MAQEIPAAYVTMNTDKQITRQYAASNQKKTLEKIECFPKPNCRGPHIGPGHSLNRTASTKLKTCNRHHTWGTRLVKCRWRWNNGDTHPAARWCALRESPRSLFCTLCTGKGAVNTAKGTVQARTPVRAGLVSQRPSMNIQAQKLRRREGLGANAY